MKNFVLVLILMVVAAPSVAETTIVFSGSPISKVESNEEVTVRNLMTADSRREFELLITKSNGKYYWASRENKELIYVRSGAFHWFIAPATGYIKIMDKALLGGEASYQYYEHLSLMLSTITYWGSGSELTM